MNDVIKMKALVGTLPLLQWWRLQNMTDEEVEKFNRKHLVEIEMGDKSVMAYCVICDSNYLSELPHDCIRTNKPIAPAMSDDASKDVWNAAIEAAACEVDKLIDHIGYGLSDCIRTLKK